MATIKPFQAVRPQTQYAEEFSSLPYDVYSEEEARALVKENPVSFMRIDRAETAFPVGTPFDDPKVYEKAKEILEGELGKGVLLKEETEHYYIYRLTMNGRAQTGTVACFSIDDYLNNVIKKHEFTRKDKEADRTHHVDVTSAHTGPIFLTTRVSKAMDAIVDRVTAQNPLYDFVSIDNVRQQVWSVDAPEDIAGITAAFKEIRSVYIADGHHRCASAVAVGQKRREEHPDYTGNEEFNYFLGVVFPSEQLYIMPYNRVVRDLNGLTKEEFLDRVSQVYDLAQTPDGKAFEPTRKGEVAMYLDGSWYRLNAKPEICVDDAVDGLDVSVLQNSLLNPILGITDPRSDSRIDFVGGIRGTKELEKRCREDMTVAFAMYPTSMDELIKVTDEGRVMPPKSTWFEPKLQSGLFIHQF